MRRKGEGGENGRTRGGGGRRREGKRGRESPRGRGTFSARILVSPGASSSVTDRRCVGSVPKGGRHPDPTRRTRARRGAAGADESGPSAGNGACGHANALIFLPRACRGNARIVASSHRPFIVGASRGARRAQRGARRGARSARKPRARRERRRLVHRISDGEDRSARTPTRRPMRGSASVVDRTDRPARASRAPDRGPARRAHLPASCAGRVCRR